jgi:leader peptidase (prepilin peptidase)/N-methyltransferase
VPPYLTVFYLVWLGLFGLVFGSFANVLIWRVPRGESIVSPGSHCPRCGHDVRWYDNLPVVSWLVLRGRCRDCGEPISIRYPIVEFASGALWVLVGVHWGISAATPGAIALFYLLLVLSAIDIDTRRLPTVLVAALAGVGIGAALFSQVTGTPAGPLIGVASSGILSYPLASAATGFVLGGGIAFAIGEVYSRLRSRSGLGFGDVRLLGALGLFLGPYVLLAFVLANIAGLFGGLAGMARRPKDGQGPASIPFGPYLALGAVATALWGPAMWLWYLHLVGL